MSQRLPALKPREVLKHSQKTQLRVTIPWHNKDLRIGTPRSIIDQAGFTVSEFVELI